MSEGSIVSVTMLLTDGDQRTDPHIIIVTASPATAIPPRSCSLSPLSTSILSYMHACGHTFISSIIYDPCSRRASTAKAVL